MLRLKAVLSKLSECPSGGWTRAALLGGAGAGAAGSQETADGLVSSPRPGHSERPTTKRHLCPVGGVCDGRARRPAALERRI